MEAGDSVGKRLSKRTMTHANEEWQKLRDEHYLSFLINPYERRVYWFEVVEVTRRLMLSGVLVCFGAGTIVQIFAACAIFSWTKSGSGRRRDLPRWRLPGSEKAWWCLRASPECTSWRSGLQILMCACIMQVKLNVQICEQSSGPCMAHQYCGVRTLGPG